MNVTQKRPEIYLLTLHRRQRVGILKRQPVVERPYERCGQRIAHGDWLVMLVGVVERAGTLYGLRHSAQNLVRSLMNGGNVTVRPDEAS